MIKCLRTNSADVNFQILVSELDAELKILDGEEHSFYAKFNKIDKIKYVIVVYDKEEVVGCGAIKKFSNDTAEVKRMFVLAKRRGEGIAAKILAELEKWAQELKFKKCILETGKKQTEAIRLYKKNSYKVIPNFGQYANTANSICFEKIF